MSQQSLVASMPLPDIAPSFNGLFLEEVVPGYRTETVSGRGDSSISLEEYTNKLLDGANIVGRKVNTREFQIVFGIVNDTIQGIRRAENKINATILQGELKIEFQDEPSMFYKGYVTSVQYEEVDSSGTGDFFERGTIVFHRSDPYKYSETKHVSKTFTKNNDTLEFDYDGLFPAKPTITVNMKSLNSLFAVSDKLGNVIEIGNSVGHSKQYAHLIYCNNGVDASSSEPEVADKSLTPTKGTSSNVDPGVNVYVDTNLDDDLTYSPFSRKWVLIDKISELTITSPFDGGTYYIRLAYKDSKGAVTYTHPAEGTAVSQVGVAFISDNNIKSMSADSYTWSTAVKINKKYYPTGGSISMPDADMDYFKSGDSIVINTKTYDVNFVSDTKYLHYRYLNYSNGTFGTPALLTTPGAYIGYYIDNNATASELLTDYTMRINSVTESPHIAYEKETKDFYYVNYAFADSADGKINFTATNEKHKYIGIKLTKSPNSYASDPSDYVWMPAVETQV